MSEGRTYLDLTCLRAFSAWKYQGSLDRAACLLRWAGHFRAGQVARQALEMGSGGLESHPEEVCAPAPQREFRKAKEWSTFFSRQQQSFKECHAFRQMTQTSASGFLRGHQRRNEVVGR